MARDPHTPSSAQAGLDSLRQTLLQRLSAANYVDPRLDEQGHLRFHSGGITFCVILDETDPEYVRLVLPNFFHCDVPRDEPFARAIAAECQRRFKLGDYTVIEQWVSAEVPLLIDGGHYLSPERLFRLTQLLRAMAQDFVGTLQSVGPLRGA